MRTLLAQAPTAAHQPPVMLELPRPDGTLAYFKIAESPIMEPALQARYPDIRTYVGQGIDDPAETVRFDLTPAGFHAQVLGPAGSWYIDPVSRGDVQHYASYWKRDLRRKGIYQCLTPDFDGQPNEEITPSGSSEESTIGPTLRTFRLAVATTGEYTAFHGGTVAAGLAAVVTSVSISGARNSRLNLAVAISTNTGIRADRSLRWSHSAASARSSAYVLIAI
jgi:hypothetical protein